MDEDHVFFQLLDGKVHENSCCKVWNTTFPGATERLKSVLLFFRTEYSKWEFVFHFVTTHLWDQIQAFETCFSVEWTDLLHIGLTQYQSGILPVLNGTQHGCPFGSWRSQYGYPLSESWPVNKGGNEHLGLVGAKFQKMLLNFGWLLESFRGKFGAIFLYFL